MLRLVAGGLAALQLAAFLLYGYDKLCAVRGWRRVPERTLLLWAVAGAAGAALGMLCFRHKIRKTKFVILVPSCLILELAGVIWGLLR